MSSALLDEFRRQYGAFYKGDTNAGDATNKSLLPAIRLRDRDGTEGACPNSEWVLLRAVVHLVSAGTFVFTDGTTALHQAVNCPANTPVVIEGPIKTGLGKALCYTTTGTGNVKVDSWSSEVRYNHTKPAGAVGT
jgi:hypothetical protein